LAIRESSKPDNFASKCVVTPIVTSSNFILRGSGTIGLENGGAAESSEVCIKLFSSFSILYFT
jgi:hypothetical protein